jgi:RNA polymerase sigma factor (sigma-70 family)
MKLKPREESVIRDMFFYGKTLEEVGQTMNVTRERIRQHLCCGLQKLKNQIIKDEEFLI